MNVLNSTNILLLHFLDYLDRMVCVSFERNFIHVGYRFNFKNAQYKMKIQVMHRKYWVEGVSFVGIIPKHGIILASKTGHGQTNYNTDCNTEILYSFAWFHSCHEFD